MKRSFFIPVLCVAAPVALSSSAPAQTLEEVRQVVETYFDSTDQKEAAQENLIRWGNPALVHLRID